MVVFPHCHCNLQYAYKLQMFQVKFQIFCSSKFLNCALCPITAISHFRLSSRVLEEFSGTEIVWMKWQLMSYFILWALGMLSNLGWVGSESNILSFRILNIWSELWGRDLNIPPPPQIGLRLRFYYRIASIFVLPIVSDWTNIFLWHDFQS